MMMVMSGKDELVADGAGLFSAERERDLSL